MKKNKKGNKMFLLAMLGTVLALGLVLAGCDIDSTPNTGSTGSNVLTSAKSIQEKIDNDTTVTKNPVASNSGKLVSATYNTATGNYTLVYKIGRANNLFSYYVTNGIPGGAGYGLSYTTSANTVKSSSFNATVSESITAGVEVGAVVKASVEATVGVSIGITETIEEATGSGATYSYSFEKLNSDKLYAFAVFSMLDFYQAFTYNPTTRTAMPIIESGKSVVYYDILDMFTYQICEYIPVNEIEFKTLEAWGSFTPAFSNADNAKINSPDDKPVVLPILPPAVATTSSIHVYDGDSIRIDEHTGQQHTFNRPVELDIETLKNLGYTKINIEMSVQIRAQDKGDGRKIWFDIDNSRVWGEGDLNVSSTSWYWKTYSTSVPISSFSNSSTFRFGFDTKSYPFTDAIWFFNVADVTFTAVK